MKKVGILLGAIVLAVTTSCSTEESGTKQEIKQSNNDLMSRNYNDDYGFEFSERPFWRDSYGQTHIGEGCLNSYAFCDPRPIIGNGSDGKSKYKIRLIGVDKLLVTCYEKVALTIEDVVNSGVESIYADEVLQNLSTSSTIHQDEILPFNICQSIMPNYQGQTIIVKKGTYPIDFSTNPNGDVLFNIEIQ